MCTAFALLLGALAPPTRVLANGPAVILVEPDPALARAVAIALEPWGAEVRSVREPSPGATMPGSAARGRALARAHDALAVVWVSSEPEGFALWVYDRRDDRVLARALPSGPPFDEPTAAEVALVVKTLLRDSPIAPAARVAPASPSRAVPLSAVLVWLTAWGGARMWSTEPSEAEARFGIDITLWPDELDDHLGVGIRLASGPGISVASPSFAGRWTDTEASLALAGRVSFAPIELAAAASFGAHLTTLDGRVRDAERATAELRVDPIAGFSMHADVRIDRRARIGLAAMLTIPITTQRYLAGEDVVLEVRRASGTLALMLGRWGASRAASTARASTCSPSSRTARSASAGTSTARSTSRGASACGGARRAARPTPSSTSPRRCGTA